MNLKDIFNTGDRRIGLLEQKGAVRLSIAEYQRALARKVHEIAVDQKKLSDSDLCAHNMSCRELEGAWVFGLMNAVTDGATTLPFGQDGAEHVLYNHTKRQYRLIAFDAPVPVTDEYQLPSLYPRDWRVDFFAECRRISKLVIKIPTGGTTILLGNGEDLPYVTPEFLTENIKDMDLRKKYFQYTSANLPSWDFVELCNKVRAYLQDPKGNDRLDEFVTKSKLFTHTAAIEKLK